MHFNGFTASPACVHNTVELADDVRKFLELKLHDSAGYVINMLTKIDREKKHNSFKTKNSAYGKILLVMLKFHFQPGGGQISLFQAPRWLLTVPKVVLGKSEDTALNEINHAILQVYSIANTYFCIKISYSKACIFFIFLHPFCFESTAATFLCNTHLTEDSGRPVIACIPYK